MRLETAQADLLLDHLGDVKPDHLLDAGSGRCALSIMANRRFGCHVDGVTISEYQVGFANGRAAELGVSDRVRYHFRNMLDTDFTAASRQAVAASEVIAGDRDRGRLPGGLSQRQLPVPAHRRRPGVAIAAAPARTVGRVSLVALPDGSVRPEVLADPYRLYARMREPVWKDSFTFRGPSTLVAASRR